MLSGGNSPTHGSVCRNWAFLGRCDYGDSCQFMHPRSSVDGIPAFSSPPMHASPPLSSAPTTEHSLLSALTPHLRTQLGPPPTIPPPLPPAVHMSPYVSSSMQAPASPALSRASLSQSVPLALPSELIKGFYAGEFPVRSFHETLSNATGVVVEANRSFFGQPEDRSLKWDLNAMRERLLISARETQPHVILPEIVQRKYHSLLLLDTKAVTPLPAPSQVLGYRSSVYKALSAADPYAYCLRRIEGFRLSNFDLVQEAVAAWSRVSHPNIVGLRQAFATGEFQEVEGQGDGGSLVYVYDYIDLAYTLQVWHEMHERVPVSDPVLWDIAMQLLSAIRCAHSTGLAVRVLHPSKILVSQRLRVHINCVGLLDAIQHPSIWGGSEKSVADAQRRDLYNLGKILLGLASGSDLSSSASLKDDADTIASLIATKSMKGLISSLLGPGHCTIFNIIEQVGYMYTFKAEEMTSLSDKMLCELRKTADISRLFQLLLRVNSIVDRPGLLDDWRWAQTGDRYIVGLFRDYLFFQTDEFGRPTNDMGHIIDALAKTDIGSGESIMLSDREANSVLVVSYLEIKRCIDTSFKQLAPTNNNSSNGNNFLL